MIQRIVILLFSISLASCASGTPNQTLYALDWKIGAGEVLAYNTMMDRIDSSRMTFNFDELLAVTDIPDAIQQQLTGLELPQIGSLISILKPNAQGNISVKMIIDEVNFDDSQSPPDDELSQGLGQMLERLEGTVQIRGELTPDGAIASFYLEERQRNLLAIFFELPTRPVAVGDHWNLDFNCVSLGSGFIADQSQKVNRVEFTELSQNAQGQSVAVLDYLMAETVSGNFKSPLSDQSTPTSMTCSFVGRGLFLIEEGRWEQLMGEFALTATGVMTANNVQHFALRHLVDVPPVYLVLE